MTTTAARRGRGRRARRPRSGTARCSGRSSRWRARSSARRPRRSCCSTRRPTSSSSRPSRARARTRSSAGGSRRRRASRAGCSSTRQPLVLDDVQSDPRFARDVAEKTGFVPQGLMAVPLLADERALGVLQVLDRPRAVAVLAAGDGAARPLRRAGGDRARPARARRGARERRSRTTAARRRGRRAGRGRARAARGRAARRGDPAARGSSSGSRPEAPTQRSAPFRALRRAGNWAANLGYSRVDSIARRRSGSGRPRARAIVVRARRSGAPRRPAPRSPRLRRDRCSFSDM